MIDDLTPHAFRLQSGEPTDPWPEDVALGCRVCQGPLEDHEWYVMDEDHPTIDAVCSLWPVDDVLRLLS